MRIRKNINLGIINDCRCMKIISVHHGEEMNIRDPRSYNLNTTELVVEISPEKKFRPVQYLNP